MELTPHQAEGLKIAIDRYKNHERYTVIAGYAGSGKSTLVRFIIAALAQYGIDPETDVCFCAYTGKATQVLARKGNKNTSTLHKLLYKSIPRPDGSFIRVLKEKLDYKLIIVDECSMIPMFMVRQLASFPVHYIFLGDHGQLPPIYKNEWNGLLDHPHIFLSEILRQAQESEIIRISMAIREGRRLKEFDGKEVKIVPKNKAIDEMYTWGDIVLVATNKTRIDTNTKIRNMLGFEDPDKLYENEKIICLRNYWDILSNLDYPLINGTIGYVSKVYEHFFRFPSYLGLSNSLMPIISADFTSDIGDYYGQMDMEKYMIFNGESVLTPDQRYKISSEKKTKRLLPYEFTLGHAITVWKAQGSSWGKVVLVEESFPRNREEHKQYLYTGLTRAEEKAVLILKD